ncbi:hypothetical protein QZH41_004525 [Actinostola sp. cb2023]|nr:hypothetical protein QZH41_004525 [Actinostola sp. cb2023]
MHDTPGVSQTPRAKPARRKTAIQPKGMEQRMEGDRKEREEREMVPQGKYVGETARNAYTRGAEHAKALEAREQRSALWTHCKEKHNGATQDFPTSIKKVLYRDAMLRQGPSN